MFYSYLKAKLPYLKIRIINQVSLLKLVICFSILLPTAAFASELPKVERPDNAVEWMPITVKESGLWPFNFKTRADGKPWSTIINVAQDSLIKSPIKTEATAEDILILKFKKNKGKFDLSHLDSKLLNQKDLQTFKKVISPEIHHVLRPEYMGPDSWANIPDAFTIKIPLPSLETRRYAYNSVARLVLDRCIKSIEETALPNTQGMTEYAGLSGEYTVSHWASNLFPMSIELLEKKVDGLPRRMCVVKNPFDEMPNYIDADGLYKIILEWGQDAVKSGRYLAPTQCNEPMKNLYYISKSVTASNQYTKIGYSETTEGNVKHQLLLVAADQDDPRICQH